ncbi:hypothetical protein QYS62_000914 [Fusarium acuminatum]|uniref:Uncharacterized protein n=1 Tax=Fusarium acuminatum TaxID=5515 RepID=A0ABZ2WH34_9HYPO
MKLTNFPVLIPAFTAQIAINDPLIISSNLLNIPFIPDVGTLVSEPGYEPPIKATFIQGSDFLRRDPDGQWVKLEVSSVARDISGAMLRFIIQIRFETDAPGLKLLQDKVYVGSGRFIVEEDRPVIVEYKISEVSAQCNKKTKSG